MSVFVVVHPLLTHVPPGFPARITTRFPAAASRRERHARLTLADDDDVRLRCGGQGGTVST